MPNFARLEPMDTFTERSLSDAEGKLGYRLPGFLRELYLTYGNSAHAGDFPLLDPEHLVLMNPDVDFPGIYSLYPDLKNTPSKDRKSVNALRKEAITGLIGVIHEGCGHYTCVATSGIHQGKMYDAEDLSVLSGYKVRPDGMIEAHYGESELSLKSYLRRWLVSDTAIRN